MLELVSAEYIEEDDEIEPSLMLICARVDPEGRVPAFFFLFSGAVEIGEVV